MLTREFYDHLEYAITRMLAASADKNINCLWCDGVIEPDSPSELSVQYVNQKREINLTAFIGKNGQDRYELTLKFGNKSLGKYARGLEIFECISTDIDTEFQIDPHSKSAMLFLD